MADKRISFRVDGKVQGVFFRQSTCKKARSIGVTGYVKNVSDGSVQGEAQGSTDAINEFIEHLNTGPPAARVTRVEQSDISIKPDESGFNTR